MTTYVILCKVVPDPKAIRSKCAEFKTKLAQQQGLAENIIANINSADPDWRFANNMQGVTELDR